MPMPADSSYLNALARDVCTLSPFTGMGLSSAGGRVAAAGKVAAVTDRVIGHYPAYLQLGEAIVARTFSIAPEKMGGEVGSCALRCKPSVTG